MEPAVETTPFGLSTAAHVAIACNAFVGVLLLLLFLVLYRACKVPSDQERLPVLSATGAERQAQPSNEEKSLLAS